MRYPQFNDTVEDELEQQGYQVLTGPSEQVGSGVLQGKGCPGLLLLLLLLLLLPPPLLTPVPRIPLS